MAWTGPTPWVKAATANRESVLFDGTSTSTFDIDLSLLIPSDNVKAVILATQDLRTGFEVGIEGADVVIRSIYFGTPSAVHAPASGTVLQTAVHGLPATPFTMQVWYVDGKISVYFNSSATAALEWDNTTNPLFIAQGYRGFASNVSGAQVLQARVCRLAPVETPRAEILVAVGGGELWASRNGDAIARIGRSLFDADAVIAGWEQEQKLYMVGGGKGAIYDPATETVSDWVPTSGKLPGQDNGVDDRPGRTSATIGLLHFGRSELAGNRLDPQNLYGSKINDPLDWNTGSVDPGRAFALNAARAGKLGQPIRALLSTGTSLFIGCDRSMWVMGGDPVLDNAVLENISISVGVSGKDAFDQSMGNQIYVHSPVGLYLIGQTAESISQDVLSKYVTLTNAEIETTDVFLLGDPSRFGVHIFRTVRATPENPYPASIHLWYDERVAKVSGGGFFIDTFPNRLGPTAATTFQGRVVCGSRDGYVWELNNSRLSDFDSTNSVDQTARIDSYAFLQLVVASSVDKEVIIENTGIILGAATTGCKFAIYGGHTAEALYDTTQRRLLVSPMDVSAGGKRSVYRRVRAHALGLEIIGGVVGTGWSLESVMIAPIEVQRLVNWSQKPIPAPPSGSTGPGVGSGSGSSTGSGSPSGSGPGSGATGFTGTGTGTGPTSGPGSGTGISGDAGGMTEF